MKFLYTYQQFNEAKQNPEELIKKYYSDLNRNILIGLIKADPTSIYNKSDDLLKIGQYVKFLVKIYKKKNLLLEDLPRARHYLKIYNDNKNKFKNFDILKYDSLDELGKLIRPYLNLESGELTPLLANLNGNSYKLLFENDEWMLYKPLTEEAACVLGVGTEWCTAWGKYSTNKDYISRSNRFANYDKDLYVFVSKKTEKPVYQLNLQHKQFMDIYDKNHIDAELKKILSNNTKMTYAIFPYLNDLSNEKNMLNAVKYTIYYPDAIRKEVNEKISPYIPVDMLNLIKNIDNNEIVDESLFSLLKLFKTRLSKEKHEEFFDTLSENIDVYLNRNSNNIVFSENICKVVISSFSGLSHYLNYLNRITSYYGGVFSDSSSSDLDTDISNIEFDIFDEDMKNKLNKIGIIDIDDLNDLKTYLNDDEKYNEINEYYGGEYADCYNSAFNNSAKSIADKVKNLIKFESGENRLKISKSDFIGYIKSYLIYQQTDVIDFDDLIEYMFDDNDLPKYDYEFNEYANDSVELDFSNVLKITKEKVYNAIEERKKEIEKEIGISDEIIAELFDRFKIVLPKLKFKIVSDNVYEFDNGTYNIKITLDKKYVNDDGTMIAMYVTYLKNKTLDGYTSPEGLENEFIKNNLINEKIKIKRKQNI